MATNQSSGSDLIGAAQARHNRIFGAYVLILVLTVLGTYLVWSSGNKVQDAIHDDANARIAEAGKATAQLQSDNLKLSGQVAGLQTDATDAKAAQQQVEIELNKQRERAANAELALLQLQEQIKPRTISPEQRTRLIATLKNAPNKLPVDVTCIIGDGEGFAFASQIDEILKSSGWTTMGVSQAIFGPQNPVGVDIIVRDIPNDPSAAAFLRTVGDSLRAALASVGIPTSAFQNLTVPEGIVGILVGKKP